MSSREAFRTSPSTASPAPSSYAEQCPGVGRGPHRRRAEATRACGDVQPCARQARHRQSAVSGEQQRHAALRYRDARRRRAPAPAGRSRSRPTASCRSGQAVRITALHADISAHSLQLTGQPVRRRPADRELARPDAPDRGSKRHLRTRRFTATARGGSTAITRAAPPSRSRASISRSCARGSRLRTRPRRDRFAGFAEGEMRIEGPALKPEAIEGGAAAAQG